MSENIAWPFEIKIGDTDLYGHMNHVAYFSYIEEATVRFLRANGLILAPGATTPLVASASCKYINAVPYPATILIDGVASRISPKKLLITHKVTSEDKKTVYAIAEKVMVWYDFKKESAIDLPQDVVNVFPFQEDSMLK